MFTYIFDKLYNRASYLPPGERSAIVVGALFVLVHWLLDLTFFFVFMFTDLHVMSVFNGISMIIGLINIYIIVYTKFKDIGLTLMIFNTCFYIGFSSFLLGYDKSANVLIPLMILVTFYFYAKKTKLLTVNLLAIFFTYCFSLHVKYQVTSMYQEVSDYIDLVNNMFAILGTFWFIFAASKIEAYSKTYTERKIKNLSEEANIDYLTGLKNRRYMENFLKNTSIQTDAYLVIGDIDFFKKVNDTYGHSCGDYIIKETSKILSKSFSASNPVCRWGGEEFLVYVKNTPNLNIANILQDIRTKIEKKTFNYNDSSIHITITLGYTKISPNHDMHKNIRNADIALYYGKETGRNTVVNFQELLKRAA